jgi:hypothetical protein
LAGSVLTKITIRSQRRNGAINGTYTVEQEGAPDQVGTFNLGKVASEGPPRDFNPANCLMDAEVNK